ncbi:hypothetical protein ACNTMW_12620 [Planosporangium sp. 12N6]|uniref:hypothetical protein n=1 Tax=Planosporangium spinosum TaxID=3402278 RepID=UPI003CE94907
MSSRYVYSDLPAGYDADHPTDVEPAIRRRSAPPSVHAVAVIGYLAGLALVAAGAGAWAAVLGDGQVPDLFQFGELTVDLRAMGLTAGAVSVFVGLFVLALARKLQRGRQWVRVAVVGLSAVSIAVTLYDGLLGQARANVLVGLVLPVVCVVLLNLPAARSWFRDRTY